MLHESIRQWTSWTAIYDYETYNDDLAENSDNTVQNDAFLPIDLLKVCFSTLGAATAAADNLNEMGPNLL